MQSDGNGGNSEPGTNNREPRTKNRSHFQLFSPLDRPANRWYYRDPMSDLMPTSHALAPRIGRDGALDAALERLVSDRLPDRPDTPDLRVTAVRRLPAVTAQY